jgi:hypothetical protein
VSEDDLRSFLLSLNPPEREHLRDVLIRDDADRNAIASTLMRYRDQNGQDWADIIDVLTRIPMLGDGSCGCLGRSTRPRPASYRLTASERRV